MGAPGAKAGGGWLDAQIAADYRFHLQGLFLCVLLGQPHLSELLTYLKLGRLLLFVSKNEPF